MEYEKEFEVVEQKEEVSGQEKIADEEQEAETVSCEYDREVIFKNLVMQANYAAHEAEAKLQVEEKGKTVTDLQGFCAGIRHFKIKAKEAGFEIPPSLFDTANRMVPWIQEIDKNESCNLDLETLSDFSRVLDDLLCCENWVNLEESIQEEIEAKKDYLYVAAKSGRDLHWIRGWDRGFNWVRSQIRELCYWKGQKEQEAERRRKEKASELPFDEE